MKTWSKTLSISLMMIVALMIVISCEESANLIYYDKDAPAPAMIEVSSITVENLHGKAVLRYTVPLDENLLYVKAIYESSPGIEREATSSRFADTLALEGFSRAGDYSVKLYTVGKNEKETGPESITVSPLAPPIEDAFSSLHMIATFGGVEGAFSNVHQAPLKAVLYADLENTGEPTFLQSFVIANPSARFTIRDLPSTPAKFFVYLIDRWGNKSETKEYTLTPLFEERLDKTLWKEYKLPSDFQDTAENNYHGYRFTHLFSGVICPKNHWAGNFIPVVLSLPSYFTIDLGVTAKISRFNMVPWWSSIYARYPKVFEIYGSAIPNPGDDLDGSEWKLIGRFRSYKPSGDDFAIRTEEDRAFIWPDGENFDVKPSDLQPDPYFPVRVIRFKIIETWWGRLTYSIDELTMWGEIVK